MYIITGNMQVSIMNIKYAIGDVRGLLRGRLSVVQPAGRYDLLHPVLDQAGTDVCAHLDSASILTLYLVRE